MIISELVHNAVQHAFNGEKEYEINITGRQQD
jgi:two-component sensor histidine kinase